MNALFTYNSSAGKPLYSDFVSLTPQGNTFSAGLPWRGSSNLKSTYGCLLRGFSLAILLGISSLASAGSWSPIVNQPTFINTPGSCTPANYPNCDGSGGIGLMTLMTDGRLLFLNVYYDGNDLCKAPNNYTS